MRLDPLGESAFIVRDLGETPTYALAAKIEAMNLPGVRECVAAYDTLGLYVDPSNFNPSQFEAAVKQVGPMRFASKRHLVPACYELGEDLPETARFFGIDEDELVSLHTGTVYRCFAIGFTPGFPYLGYLNEAIAGVPRRAEPRVRVDAGSIGITGRQTGIYPSVTPGGWALLAKTPVKIVDVQDGFFPISAGDEVQFEPISKSRFDELAGTRLGSPR